MTIWYRPKGSGYSGGGSSQVLTVRDLWYRRHEQGFWECIFVGTDTWRHSFDFGNSLTDGDMVRMGLIPVAGSYATTLLDPEYRMDIGL